MMNLILTNNNSRHTVYCSQYVITNRPVVIAWFEDMQACVTVWAGTLSEKPAPRAAWLIKKQPQNSV